jgi:HEAT repeat protein
MGRTYDSQWDEFVLQQLDSEDPEMTYEAARAAGELEIEEAVPALTRLALDNDREVKEVAIWALGEIGTKESSRILERLATEAKHTNDEELLEAIEDAIGTASLSSGSLYLMRFDESSDDD